MLHVSHFVSVKTLNTLIKRSSPHSIVTKKMYKQISSVHGSSVLTVKGCEFAVLIMNILCCLQFSVLSDSMAVYPFPNTF